MKIIQAHNYYKITGGEDTVVKNERLLLTEKGHEVIPFIKKNSSIDGFSKMKKAKLVKETYFSTETYDEVIDLITKTKADICHVHNFLPLISPSIFYACKELNVPVVFTLHNFRLICTQGSFIRNGEICEKCLAKSPMNSIKKKCYRNSYLQTFALANMLDKHNKLDTWNTKVDQFLTFTEFGKRKFVSHGLSPERITIKPNFVEDNYPKLKHLQKENYIVFVGRVEADKGAPLLESIANQINVPIKVVGEGDLLESLSHINNIDFLGKKPYSKTLEIIRKAKILVFPSITYEGMPMTILEAFSLKTAVVSSNLGSMASIIEHDFNGKLCKLNSAESFSYEINTLLNDTEARSRIEENAYHDYITNYSKESNYKQLINVYNKLLNKKSIKTEKVLMECY